MTFLFHRQWFIDYWKVHPLIGHPERWWYTPELDEMCNRYRSETMKDPTDGQIWKYCLEWRREKRNKVPPHLWFPNELLIEAEPESIPVSKNERYQLIPLYKEQPLDLDSLYKTDEFEELYAKFQKITGNMASRHEVSRALFWLRKQDLLPAKKSNIPGGKPNKNEGEPGFIPMTNANYHWRQ